MWDSLRFYYFEQQIIKMDQVAGTAEADNVYSIKLVNGAEALREIYYADGRGTIFTYPPTRNCLLGIGIAAVVSVAFYLCALSNLPAAIICFGLSLIVAFAYLYLFLRRADAYFKWKKGIDTYLKQVDDRGDHHLKLSASTLEFINKKETTIEKWSALKKASITPDLIRLDGNPGSSYLLPAKSMSPSEYEFLEQYIRQRMQSTNITPPATTSPNSSTPPSPPGN